ncbi:helix-turn-helix transcriptional regulator [Arthrobacter globiformis]|uniref:helix-turn-helix transcriptional regulator n=1 Tax=Arthrobacter globiformis TaxID=1665 RepID=UPI0026786976|nr:helix-turn-helix transcriptional regulator [Arthrobacter globiformis]
MRALNPGEARQASARSLHSPISDYKVVVLGVMYPNVFSRQPSNPAIEEATCLLHDPTFVRQHTAVIFYHPFSPDGSEKLKQYRPSGGNGRDEQEQRCRKAAKGRQGNRREAIQAVVSDLARLSARIQEPKPGVDVQNKLRDLRIATGMSQGEFAAALEVSRQTIQNIEVGRYLPSLPLAIAIARYFRRPVEEIFIPCGVPADASPARKETGRFGSQAGSGSAG